MKTVSLSGSSRKNVGKKDASALRSSGQVPCVIYGGKEQAHFSVDLVELGKYVYTPDVFRFELEIDGKKTEAILKDMQFHPVTDEIIHADFLEIIEGKPVKMKLPVRVIGNAIGVKNGGVLATNFRRVDVLGLAKDFPDSVVVDISHLRIGMAVRVNEIQYPGVTLLHNDNSIVVAVKNARGAIEDELEDEEGEEGEEGAEGAEGEESSGEDKKEEASADE
ncbi:MAG: 50S ribosomal protein L25/general stress protein Ctc [Cryomorphaceae bacterium]